MKQTTFSVFWEKTARQCHQNNQRSLMMQKNQAQITILNQCNTNWAFFPQTEGKHPKQLAVIILGWVSVTKNSILNLQSLSWEKIHWNQHVSLQSMIWFLHFPIKIISQKYELHYNLYLIFYLGTQITNEFICKHENFSIQLTSFLSSQTPEFCLICSLESDDLDQQYEK